VKLWCDVQLEKMGVDSQATGCRLVENRTTNVVSADHNNKKNNMKYAACH
jgi:hypothetical protein